MTTCPRRQLEPRGPRQLALTWALATFRKTCVGMAHGPELPLSFACLQVDDVGKRKGQAGRSLPVPRGESIGSRCRWGTSQILTTSESPEMFYRDLTFTVP